jgi:hypothetical protein
LMICYRLENGINDFLGIQISISPIGPEGSRFLSRRTTNSTLTV